MSMRSSTSADENIDTTSRVRTLRWIILLVVIVSCSAYITVYFTKQDFWVYYASGISILNGRTDFYAPDFANGPIMDYRYPPFFIIVFAPFALLPPTIAAFLWAALSVTASVAAFQCLSKLLRSPILRFGREGVILGLAVVLTAKYILIALKYQNVHLIVVALFTLSFCLLIERKIFIAAWLMALATIFKLFPLASLPYFAIKKQWKFLGFTCAFLIVMVVIPSFYLGITRNFEIHRQWYEHVVEPSDYYELNGPPNLSIHGQVVRYFSQIKYDERTSDKNYRNVNIANYDVRILRSISWSIAFIIFLITFTLIWSAGRNRQGRKSEISFDGYLFHELGLVICASLLAGPRTNIVYFTAMFVPVAALLSSVFAKRSRMSLSALVVVAVATIVLPLVPGSTMQRLFLVVGIDFYAAFALWLALAVEIWRAARIEPPELRAM